jgi:CheY-like chemotaxis protein
VAPRRILVVDDEDHIREVAQVALELVGGYEVLTASCAAEGLARALADRPDAILLDVMMPDMDGPTAFERLRADERTRDIPVVFLTAKVQSADRRRLSDLGAMAVIAKPFDPMRLSEELAQVLGWSE